MQRTGIVVVIASLLIVLTIFYSGTCADQGEDLLDAARKNDLAKAHELLDSGTDPNAKGIYVYTPLMWASKMGHVELARLLLQKGANVNAKTEDSRTALMVAAQAGRVEIVRLLIEKGADVNATDRSGDTALSDAVRERHLEVAKLLKVRDAKLTLADAVKEGDIDAVRQMIKDGADINMRWRRGRTALIQAVADNKPEIVKLLIEKGADVNLKSLLNETALDLAVLHNHADIAKLLGEHGAKPANLTVAVMMKDLNRVRELIEGGKSVNPRALILAAENDDLEIAKFLVRKGANVNGKWDDDGKTALMAAANAGHTEMIKLLIERGADVNAVDRGYTALMFASEKSHVAIVRLLLEKGANIDSEAGISLLHWDVLRRTASRGITPREVRWTALKKAAWAGNTEIARLLIEKGADVNSKDEFGWTPLMFAAISERDPVDVARLLIEKGADVNSKLKDGVTPLMFAASAGNLEVLKLVIEKGADVNYKYESDWTPLMSAAKAEGDRIEVVKLLIEKGADINAKDERGETPLSIAEKYNQSKVVQYLKEHGATVIEAKISFSVSFNCGADEGSRPRCLADAFKPGLSTVLLGKKGICGAKTADSFYLDTPWACSPGFEATNLSGAEECAATEERKSWGWIMAVLGVEPTAVRLLSPKNDNSPVSKEIESKARKLAAPEMDPPKKIVDDSSVPIGLVKKPPRALRMGDITLLTFQLEADGEPWEPGPTVVVKEGQVFLLEGACTYGEPMFFSVNGRLYVTYHGTVNCCACGDTNFFVYDLSGETPEMVYANSSFSD
jgi:ankyrin repeat protein